MTSKIPRCCHPDDRKDLALSLAKSQRGMLRFAQHDTKYLSKHLLFLYRKGRYKTSFPFLSASVRQYSLTSMYSSD